MIIHFIIIHLKSIKIINSLDFFIVSVCCGTLLTPSVSTNSNYVYVNKRIIYIKAKAKRVAQTKSATPEALYRVFSSLNTRFTVLRYSFKTRGGSVKQRKTSNRSRFQHIKNAKQEDIWLKCQNQSEYTIRIHGKRITK